MAQDSLRFSLATRNSAGNDMRFSNKKVGAARNFCNKVYNASRFVQMNIGDEKIGDIDMAKLDIADKWILHRLNAVAGEVTSNMDNFELNVAAQKAYDFIWTEFCDWYIDTAKPRLPRRGRERQGKREGYTGPGAGGLHEAAPSLHAPFITGGAVSKPAKRGGDHHARKLAQVHQ